MDLNRIKELIKLVEHSDITGLAVEEGDAKIEIKKGGEVTYAAAPAYAAPVASAASAPAPAKEAKPDKDPHAGLTAVKSPMAGTFYIASSPDSPAFVKPGDHVTKGKTVCIVEAMKTFNEIETEVTGKVEKILLANASPVELGQPLLLIRE